MLQGIGVTICPVVAVRAIEQKGRLKMLDLAVPETTVIMIWHKNKWCSPLLKHFMELAEKELSD